MYVPDGYRVTFGQKYSTQQHPVVNPVNGFDVLTGELHTCWVEIHGALNVWDAHQRAYRFLGQDWAGMYLPNLPPAEIRGRCVGRVP